MIKYVVLLIAFCLGVLLIKPIDYLYNTAYENRAVHAGYYCKDTKRINPAHLDQCKRVLSGTAYKEAFPEFYR